MTKFEIRQCRRDGKFTNKADIYLFDRLAPQGIPYVQGVTMEHAVQIVAREMAAFTACDLPATRVRA